MMYVNRGEPSRKMSFPLIARLYMTGEALNPWRCDACLTKRQRTKAPNATPSTTTNDICCRKCGVGR